MVIVLIRRCVKPDKEPAFLDSYKREKPKHPDFVSEYLTKIDDDQSLPESMRNLDLGCKRCVTYLNVAFWKSAASFNEYFKPKKMHDPELECEDRLRVVLTEVEFD